MKLFNPKNQVTVEQVHNEFFIAGEKLLAEANTIVNKTEIDNDKLRMLSQYGFTKSKEFTELQKVKDEIELSEKLAKKLTVLYNKYPCYKFITKKEVERICDKYGLVMGEVGNYKGDIPKHNLIDIDKFFTSENELNTVCYEHYYNIRAPYFGGNDREISYEEFKEKTNQKKYQKNGEIEESGYRYKYYSEKKKLKIVAPIKDFDVSKSDLKGYKLIDKPVPDPIVMVKAEDYIYCIITAWGEEAKEVVNPNNN
jgi:hypothetical protein